MKYNKSEIMKEAWKLFKSCTPAHRAPFGRYLAMAWNRAKKAAEKAARMANRQEFTGFATITTEYGKAVDFRIWHNYGKRRIYCSLGNAYIDLSDGRICAKGSAKEACERFLEMYTVA